MHIVTSDSAAARLDAARRFVLAVPPATEILIVSASRGAADDFARLVARGRGATFGLYRFSLTQLAARLAAPLLARAAPVGRPRRSVSRRWRRARCSTRTATAR